MEALDWEGKLLRRINAAFNTAVWVFYICVSERTAVLDKIKGPPSSRPLPCSVLTGQV